MEPKDLFTSIIFTTLIIILLISVVVITIINAGKERLKLEMKLANAALDYEKELRFAEAEIGENTKEFVGRELHDNIGHSLVLLHLQMQNGKLTESLPPEFINPIEKQLIDVLQQVRLLSRSMNASYLGDIGLAEALVLEVQRLEAVGNFEIILILGETHYDNDRNRDLMVFRIAQELISNAIKHSMAKRIEIHAFENDFLLKVIDNGNGFNAEAILASPKASGLKNIKKRAQLAGINFELSTAIGNGCSGILSVDTEPKLL